MKFKLNKYEKLVLDWYIFLKKPKRSIIALINRFRADRMLGK